MNKSLKVIYENGVLRPLEPVLFREHQQVTVLVLEDQENHSNNKTDNLYDLAFRSGILGMVDDQPSDLSTNQKYFEGFGSDHPSCTY